MASHDQTRAAVPGVEAAHPPGYARRQSGSGPLAILGALLLSVACAPIPPALHGVSTPAAGRVPTGEAIVAGLSPDEVDAEFLRLKVAFAQEVPRISAVTLEHDHDWIVGALAVLAESMDSAKIEGAQLILVVDRNKDVQEAVIMLVRPDAAWAIVGGTRVLTGQPGHRGYYVTPTGVFPQTTDILDFRAEGACIENGIRAPGGDGVRVWDFGWQMATKGRWPDEERGVIRLLLRATDPDRLRARIGRPPSQGCVHIPAALSLFMDLHGVLDRAYEKAALTDARLHALLRPDRTPTLLAGSMLVVIDSSVAR